MYGLGVILAILSGIAHNIGMLVQKRVVNRITGDRQGFFSKLIRNPMWLAGLVIQVGLGTTFFLLAQLRLGPALIPGLMASGMIVLILGSTWILKEPLGFAEISGVILLMAAIALLGLTRLTIDVGGFDVLARRFLLRAVLFSSIMAGLLLALEILAKRPTSYRGSFLAVSSGLFYALSNFWIGPFLGSVLRLLKGNSNLPVIALFAAGSAILVVTNLLGIARLQLAFRVTNASLAIPIQQVPVQVTPAFVYLAVFHLAPPSAASVPLFCLGTILIIASTFMLARRQRTMEGIPAS